MLSTYFPGKDLLSLILLAVLVISCSKPSPVKEEDSAKEEDLFPDELIAFTPYEKNPVFTGTGGNTWDEVIRERGYILRESGGYHLWYTGYRKDAADTTRMLGYATSPDGLVWTRYQNNPLLKGTWIEDMMVIKSDSVYYMFAEGSKDVAHMLTSTDKIHWNDQGSLKIRYTNGQPLTPGPYGTPTVFIEDGVWYLFYERDDNGIWLASSRDLKEWTNLQDEPVIEKGPETYDKFGVAVNQVIKYRGLYYAYYHGTAFEDWSVWSTNIAVSKNLRDWEKYSLNPILKEDKSSGILVHDGSGYRLYTMHAAVEVHFPADSVEVVQ